MAKTKISEYDSTAANNTDIDGINIAEGCAPSGINNAIRELMAHLKDMNIGSTITMLNTTEEDTDGGRANKIIFKGEQSGGEESVLGEIQASHDGAADDQKGDLIFKTNDGSDGTSPTEAMRIASDQRVHVGGSTDVTTAVSGDNVAPKLLVEHTTATSLGILRQDTSIASGNSLGSLGFYGTDTTSNTPIPLAAVQALASGTHAAGDNPTDLRFFTTPDGSATLSEAMRIDSSGNIGIGTTSPNTRFYVEAGTNNSDIARFTGDQTTKGLLISTFSSGGNDGGVTLQADNKLSLKTGSETALTVDSSQRVGIGTTSPSTALHVSSGTAGTCVVTIEADTDNNDEGDVPSIKFVQDGGATVNTIGVEGTSGTAFTDSGGNNLYLLAGGTGLDIDFATNGALRGKFDPTGSLLIGKTSADNTTDGIRLNGADNYISAVRDGEATLILNRRTSDGEIILLRQDNSTIGRIGTSSSDRAFLSVTGHGISLDASGNSVLPSSQSGGNLDNTVDLGASSSRYDDVHATNGTIQTSDEREKQQIASMTGAEIIAAKAISKLFKTFKWNDAVTEKGDDARTHTGVIAQQVETAMSDAGLDAGNYAFFISDTWWETQTEVAAVEADEENGIEAQEAYTHIISYYTQEEAPEGAIERNRKGIRYPELLSFIGAATEQRLTSIEARLDALEG